MDSHKAVAQGGSQESTGTGRAAGTFPRGAQSVSKAPVPSAATVTVPAVLPPAPSAGDTQLHARLQEQGWQLCSPKKAGGTSRAVSHPSAAAKESLKPSKSLWNTTTQGAEKEQITSSKEQSDTSAEMLARRRTKGSVPFPCCTSSGGREMAEAQSLLRTRVPASTDSTHPAPHTLAWTSPETSFWTPGTQLPE